MTTDVLTSLTGVFGHTFTTALEQPILVIGRDRWSRLDLADIGITQLRAARIVSGLALEVGAKSTADLFRRLQPADLANHVGAGLHSLFVLWRAFESKGFDSRGWYWNGRDGAIRTFTTLKARERRRQAEETKRQTPRARAARRAKQDVRLTN